MNHSAECTCEESLCETLRAFSAQHPESVLYQTSLMSALLSGVYEGSTTIADLLKHGDFGLGTFNELDGELIAFSSQVYQLRADGSARKAQPEQKNAVRGDDLVPAAVPENL
ncbi:Alpha-acetolactate decarboxylase [Klebsiella pneumoniae IS46]|uniref:Alpha-acetolactate decarboxylase n=2 Tax=Klebsiella pneumoniae TaxID=573 RepID=A0A2X3ESB3_KLEPN|nr:Alpha-acetolactate decarboxylase [Klebsiella pneumoniae IS43]CDL13412.1 Alpha-acetolactate decarboxylase [Klebsiella pneumoniae IS46]CDL24149.1 Alpha-acetolactate decarboxylase [Klebsiella pneumoniae IS53]SQC36635.1 alpha-acetolactate decarboxylase [Klebsiella pneumoniae]